jgi:hypothetical protein
VAVANPSDLDRYTSFTSNQPLPPVIVEDELARARTALQGLEVETLEAPVTMRRLVSRLDHCSRNGMPIDVLYIVCHGRYVAADDGTSTGDSVLFLERDDGGADRVSGRSLALRIGDLARPPTVAVLCSCQSAGEGVQDTLDAGALSAIGPELAKRGVPAVVAMQGNVSVDGAREFFTEFFRQLHVDGIVDRAVAAGRQAISNTPDWWMPVLFSRLRTGATYYVPGFGDGGEHIWDDIVTAVESGKCTPIVGSGLTDSILGSREAMANRWVRRWQVPVARHAQSDLATVSQYLRVRTSAAHPARELSQYVLSELRQSFADVVDPAVLESRDPDKIISAVGKLRRKENPDDPFAAVARIEAPVYFTTSWTTLLEDALEEAGRPAVSRFFDWNDVDDEENNEDFGKPSLEKPLVFHLFGKFAQPESLVLSEEDYFVWLRAWIDRRSFYTDKGFGKALTRQPLMFLGYRLDDWDFRVLFQGIKSFGGSAQLERNTHVAVQISRDSVVIEPEVVQDYLESYFQADKVHIYWGESTAFLKQLSSKRSLAKV